MHNAFDIHNANLLPVSRQVLVMGMFLCALIFYALDAAYTLERCDWAESGISLSVGALYPEVLPSSPFVSRHVWVGH